MQIDNNKLAAYLDGTLSKKEREKVEEAIEHSDELKAVVDEWILMSDDMCNDECQEDDRDLRKEACECIHSVMHIIKQSEYKIQEKSASSHKYIYRKFLVAASILVFVSAAIMWMFNSPWNKPSSSFDVPMNSDFGENQSKTDTTVIDSCAQYSIYSQ